MTYVTYNSDFYFIGENFKQKNKIFEIRMHWKTKHYIKILLLNVHVDFEKAWKYLDENDRHILYKKLRKKVRWRDMNSIGSLLYMFKNKNLEAMHNYFDAIREDLYGRQLLRKKNDSKENYYKRPNYEKYRRILKTKVWKHQWQSLLVLWRFQ